MIRHSRLISVTFFSVGFVTILGILGYLSLSFFLKSGQNTSSIIQADALPEPITVIVEFKKSNNSISIRSAQLSAGDNFPLVINDSPLYYVEQVLEGEVVDSITLDFSQHDTHQLAEEEQTAIAALSYFPNADLILKDVVSGESYPLNNGILEQAIAKPPPTPIHIEVETVNIEEVTPQVMGYTNTMRDGYLDVVFISSNFNDQQRFDQLVNELAVHLANFDPFDKYKSKIRVKKIFTRENMKCLYKEYTSTQQVNIYCDPFHTYQILSQTAWDAGVVLHDDERWGAVAHYSQIVNLGIGTTPAYKHSFIHEMGHVVGKLSDEYVYQGSAGSEDIKQLGPNCDVAGCPKWSGVAGTQCIPGCTYPHAYKSTPDSMMHGSGSQKQFNTVSKNSLVSYLENYTTLPSAPPPPQIRTGCQTETREGYKVNAPYIEVKWNQYDVVKEIHISEPNNPSSLIKASTDSNAIMHYKVIRDGTVFEEYTLDAPETFVAADNKPGYLKDSTTYHVKYWDGKVFGSPSVIATPHCSSSVDLNADKTVNIQDFELLKTEFGKKGPSGFSKADIGRDGEVDIYDYNFFLMYASYFLRGN